MSRYSHIIATGGYLPERVLSNHDLEQMVDTSDEWIQARTGIRSRHVVSADEKTVDLAEAAARQALADAGLNPQDLDLIIVATTTSDQIFPSTACLLQARLGNRGSPAFDVQAVCTGFIYALACADQFIRSGTVRR
ncbi:thiolase family protein, partial [Acidithiobacillus sp.]